MGLNHSPSIVTNGLVLYLDAANIKSYPGSGSNWNDLSGNNNNATLTDPPTYSNNGFLFNGSSNYATINNSVSLQPGLNSWSVEFWINLQSVGIGDYPQIIGSRPWSTNTDLGWAVCYGSSLHKVCAHYADGSSGFDVPTTNIAQSNSIITIGTVQHWVVVFDILNSKLNFYLNGVLDLSNTVTYPRTTINQNNTAYIGREIQGSNLRRLNAILYKIAVYNRALLASEIQQNFNALRGRYNI